ncbi:cupin domain-containing protein [Mariprofundus ferrooxydans]|uniref:Cupin type-2 domain-containing protein n=1 Tax=Mariprofundus ferrooxydans PV-1 TaxID=314345 RepID=Q0F235_9PROT|nr:cupin domain-containing protein [Mariprofundus ferrooxydans]EAU55715.1 hypothetical protein SPV1_02167 [Mariprofundus ferrooxydans PV-1]KON47878.1 hypothetical protein AL013_05185 [Mariprofundus ferrooxydans]
MKLVQLAEIDAGPVNHTSGIMRKILLGEGDLPASVRLSHALFKPGESVEMHKHDRLFEVFYVLSGQGQLIVEERPVDIGAGSCFMVEPGEMHALINDGDVDMALIYFGLHAD